MKRWILLGAGLLVLFGAGVGVFIRQSSQWAERINETTDPQTLSGPLQVAWRAARIDAARWPVNEAALVQLTEVALTNGLWDDADRLLVALIQRQPNEPRWLHLQAVLSSGRGELEPAVENWRKVAKMAPQYLPARVRLADVLAKMNKRAEAEDVYRQVLAIEPDHPYAIYGLVRLQVQAGEFAAALEQLEAAIKKTPDFYGLHALRQAAARATGQARLAEAADVELKRLGRYIEIPDPWFDPVLEKCFDAYRASVVGSAFFAQRAWAQGEQWYGRAVELNPQDASSWRWVGACASQQKRFDVAREAYRKSTEFDPQRWETFLWWANLEDSLDRPKEALAVVTAGMQHHPEVLQLLRLRIMLLMKLGNPQAAAPFINTVLKLDPDDRDLQELRAFLRARGWMR